MQWDPKQYNIFKQQRREPFDQLVELVRPHSYPGMRIVDLGCGTGEWTRALHQALDARETVGIDSSDEMLSKANAFAGDGVRFERGDKTRYRSLRKIERFCGGNCRSRALHGLESGQLSD